MSPTSTPAILHLAWIISSALLYEILRIIVAPALFHCYTKDYGRLSTGKKRAWGIRFSSISNSIIVVTLAVVSLSKPGVWTNPFQAHPWSVQASISITAGYFVADMYWMLRYPVESGAHYAYKFHHVFSLFGFYSILSYPMLGHLLSIRLLSELSQPFLHFRVPMYIHMMWFSAGAFLDILNIYWFTLLVRGMRKILMEYCTKQTEL
ncbi:TLC domain-containing protein 4-A-like isoform X2 [Styela clava]